jgi:hypothetical protein
MKTAPHTFTGPGRISISLGWPRGAPAGYKVFKKLAPTRDMLSMTDEKAYERLFHERVLNKLDPQKTWDELHALAGANEPVIQCFEKPPFTARNWCHRRMVARWFQRSLGKIVPEVGFEHDTTPTQDSSYANPGDAPQGALLRVAEKIRSLIDVAGWRIRRFGLAR